MNKNLKQIIRYNHEQLKKSKKDLKSIFEIMFHAKNNILCEGNDGFRIYKYSYREMHKKITSAATGLYKKIGATHGYIALEIENSPDWIVAFWAILMSGNKPYLVNTRYPKTLTDSILKTLEIKYTLSVKESELDTETIILSSLAGDNADLPDSVFEDEIAFSSSATSMNEVICFYSGYQISEQILNFESIIKENPRMAKHYKGNLKQLAFLPFYHVFGLFAVYFWFTFFGRTLVFLRDYSADTILKTCRRHSVTHIFAVPVLWHTIEKQILSSVKEKDEKTQKKFYNGIKKMTRLQNLLPTIGPEIAKRVMKDVTEKLFGPSIVFCINGGSYLRDSAMELMNGIGYSMHNGYGMSEIGITSVELRNTPKARNLNSIGKPFDSVEYKINENGILMVKGSSLCTKKLVNGTETSLEGWFDTGDNMQTKDGYYYILGRSGDVVIGENGENINPDVIEKLFRIDSAKMLSVLGLDGEDGQELSLIVQINQYATEKHISDIKNQVYAINNTLPTASAIRKFYFTCDQLAPTTAVKVSRKQLIKKIKENTVKLTAFSDYKVAASNGDNPLSPLYKEVAAIIAETLDISPQKIQPESHIFYDLGATSIQYFSILTQLSQRFTISDYDKNEKYRYTPKEICEYIERYL